MKNIKMNFKKGAASFYVVAFSTLILVILAASFATAIVAEVTRTENEDLSQSAYDAALAGVEDAKLAFLSYENCIKQGVSICDSYRPSEGTDITCSDIIYWMRNPDCDMVAHILGRIGKNESGEVVVEETTSSNGSAKNNMNQAYTCTMINTNLTDYRADLSASNSYKVVKVDLNGVAAKDIKSVRVSWFSNSGRKKSYTNFYKNRVTFQPFSSNTEAVPPTIAVQMIQTAGGESDGKEYMSGFTFEQIGQATTDGRTDRATVYLVPVATSDVIEDDDHKVGSYGISAEEFANTNNRAKNLPYVVSCSESSEYACSTTIDLPLPIGGDRNSDTFMFVISLPYGGPSTDFALEFCNEDSCGDKNAYDLGNKDAAVVKLGGMQVSIDSTGRANDLYRRVELRMESEDSNFSYPFYAIQALGDDGYGYSLKKDLVVTTESN